MLYIGNVKQSRNKFSQVYPVCELIDVACVFGLLRRVQPFWPFFPMSRHLFSTVRYVRTCINTWRISEVLTPTIQKLRNTYGILTVSNPVHLNMKD